MPDKEIIQRRINAFLETYNNLKKYENITSEDFKQNLDLLWILERGLYLLIQNLLDIFSHIVASDFNERWNNYTDIPEILFNNNFIQEEQRKLLNQMIGFRNRLAHEYLSLDKEVLQNIINHKLPELFRFLTLIKDYCKL